VTGVILADGEQFPADVVIVNADVAAVARGLLGAGIASTTRACPPKARSLSAISWAMNARTSGFPLSRHNVFFSSDYTAEFSHLQAGALPDDPTVYVCAQARNDADLPTGGLEPLFCLVNAPARSDVTPLTPSEITQCEMRTFAQLKRCGLEIERQSDAMAVTTPTDFETMYPATGGALYGPASHGWMASFRRSGARCRVPGLYFAGGSTHPGPGVPMAAISGRLAAEAVLADLGSTQRSRPAAMSGGTSMR
jgi:1-hydroxycarotenoid 3,4-desaturase